MYWQDYSQDDGPCECAALFNDDRTWAGVSIVADLARPGRLLLVTSLGLLAPTGLKAADLDGAKIEAIQLACKHLQARLEAFMEVLLKELV